MKACTNPESQRAIYHYDPFDRRIAKHKGEHEHVALWDGGNILQEEYRSDNKPYLSRDCLYDGNIPVPIAFRSGAQFCYLVSDQVGSPIAGYDTQGICERRAAPRTWRSVGGDLQGRSPFSVSFPGQTYDPDCDCYYNRHRYYDGLTAHYLSPDPLRLRGGLNVHSYVICPTNSVDPLGLASTPLNYTGKTGGGYTIYGIQNRGGDMSYVGISEQSDVRALQHEASGRYDPSSQDFVELDHADTYGEARGYEQAYAEKYNTVDTSQRGTPLSPDNNANRQNPLNTDRDDDRGQQMSKYYQKKKAQLSGSE